MVLESTPPTSHVCPTCVCVDAMGRKSSNCLRNDMFGSKLGQAKIACNKTMTLLQINCRRLMASGHPTERRLRKVKAPPIANFPPMLPESIARHRIDISSEDATEEKEGEHEAKRQRSTPNAPRSDSAWVWAPHEYDGVMKIGPVGSSSDEKDNPEPTDLETRSRIEKTPKGSPQTALNNSGVDKSPKGDVAVLVSWRQLSLTSTTKSPCCLRLWGSNWYYC